MLPVPCSGPWAWIKAVLRLPSGGASVASGATFPLELQFHARNLRSRRGSLAQVCTSVPPPTMSNQTMCSAMIVVTVVCSVECNRTPYSTDPPIRLCSEYI
jgi:hypothetical protein